MRFQTQLALAIAFNGLASTGGIFAQTTEPGRVNLIKTDSTQFDGYIAGSDANSQQWMRDHFWRMKAYTPFFDEKTSWFSNALFYADSYAVYPNYVAVHPDWVLRDASGNPLYINWACDANTHTCPQFAADVSNPGFQQWWIDEARNAFSRGGYKGIWIDDVNLDWRISNGDGTFVQPVNPQTGGPMSLDDWRGFMVGFLERIRREFPDIQIIHNSLWYAGGDSGREWNPYIQRQIAAADQVNIEHGVNDGGLTGGTGDWSLERVLTYIENVNAQGRGVIIDGLAENTAGLEYAVACYLLASNGNNAVGDLGMAADPHNWWPGFDVNLGTPLWHRYDWNGLQRRDFTGGTVFVNEPGAPWRTAWVNGPYRKLDGTWTDHVDLGPGQGVILQK